MTVALDAILEFATFTTTSPATLSFTPTGTPRAIAVYIAVSGGSTEDWTVVTYGGVPMDRIGFASDTSGELGGVGIYFLGAGIPTGNQTVSITHSGSALTKWAAVRSYTAAGDTICANLRLYHDTVGNFANPSLIMRSIGGGLRTGVIFSGHDAISSLAPLSGMEALTTANSHDFGTDVAALAEETTASSGDFTIGFTATGEDVAFVAITIEEEVADDFPDTAAVTLSYFNDVVTSHAVRMPPVVNTGDGLLAAIAHAFGTTTTPSGWTLLHNNASGANVQTYYKEADGSEAGTTVDFVTSIASRATAYSTRIVGWDAATPPEVAAATGTSTAPNSPSLTPSWGAEDTLWFAQVALASNPLDITFPANYDNGSMVWTLGTNSQTIGVTRRKLNAASEDPAAFAVISSMSWTALTIAWPPAAANIALDHIATTAIFALTLPVQIQLNHIGPTAQAFSPQPLDEIRIFLPRITGTFVHTPSIDDAPPSVVINTPVGNQVVGAGGTVSLTSTVTGSHGPFTYAWTFAGSSGITTLTTADPGSVQFDQVGTHMVTLVVTDALGNESAPQSFSVTVLPAAPEFVDNRGVWCEAWELPHKELVGYDAKKIGYLPTIDYMAGLHADAFREEGAITLHATYDRLAEVMDIDPEDHLNDVASAIKFFHAAYVDLAGFPRPFAEFVTERRPDKLISKHQATTQITGRGLTSFYLDRTKLLPWDYPLAPKSLEEDWHYGAANELPNPGFEEGSVLNEKQTIWVAEQPDPLADWSISFSLNGVSTAAIEWKPNTTEIEDAMLAAWTQFLEIRVTGAGVEADPWVIEFVDPPGFDLTSQIVVLGGSLFNSFNVVATVQNGGVMLPTNWEPSQNPITGIQHGLYEIDGFRLALPGEVTPVEGVKALYINPEGTTTFQAFPGAQQIVPVLPGHRYFGYVSVNPLTAGGAFTLVIRYVDRADFNSSFEEGDTYGEVFIAASSPQGSGEILLPNTWTQLLVEFTVPVGVEEIIFRVARNGGTFPTFFVDDARLSPGAPAASWGKIWGEVYADAAFDHVLQGRETLHYFNKTWDDDFDSGGNAWLDDHPENISISLPADMSYGQIAEQGQNLYGFIHRIVWNPETGVYDFNIYNKGKAGIDLPTFTNTGTLTAGMNIADGEALKAAPAASYIRVRGKDGIWAEQRNVALEDAWGQAETSVDEPDLSGDFLPILAHHHEKLLTDMIAFEINLHADGQVIPFVHFNLFDIVQVNPGDNTGIDPQNLHVVSIVVSGTGHEKPKFQIHVGTDVFTSSGAAAQAEGLRRLLRHWNRRRRTPRTIPRPNVGCCPSCVAIINAVLTDDMPIDSTSGDLEWIIDVDNDGLLEETANFPTIIRPGYYTVQWNFLPEWLYTGTGWSLWRMDFLITNNDGPDAIIDHMHAGDAGLKTIPYTQTLIGNLAESGVIVVGWDLTIEQSAGLIDPTSGLLHGCQLTVVRHNDGCARPPELSV